MLDTYRRILSLPDTLLFSLTGLVARLPISMVGLGIVLLVSDRIGSYGLAGTVSAASVVASAAGSPMQGRLTDRFGQHRVLPAMAAVFATGSMIADIVVGATTQPIAPAPSSAPARLSWPWPSCR